MKYKQGDKVVRNPQYTEEAAALIVVRKGGASPDAKRAKQLRIALRQTCGKVMIVKDSPRDGTTTLRDKSGRFEMNTFLLIPEKQLETELGKY